jgi:GNAT superfamily N-acetyltransferase
MPARSRKPSCVIRCGCVDDLDDLCELERQVFADDNMSRRSLRHFLVAASAEVVVAEHDGRIAGCAVVLFRPNSLIARLYSIAVAPRSAGRGLGPALLIAAEYAITARSRATARPAISCAAGSCGITRTGATRCGLRSGWRGRRWAQNRRMGRAERDPSFARANVVMGIASLRPSDGRIIQTSIRSA